MRSQSVTSKPGRSRRGGDDRFDDVGVDVAGGALARGGVGRRVSRRRRRRKTTASSVHCAAARAHFPLTPSPLTKSPRPRRRHGHRGERSASTRACQIRPRSSLAVCSRTVPKTLRFGTPFLAERPPTTIFSPAAQDVPAPSAGDEIRPAPSAPRAPRRPPAASHRREPAPPKAAQPQKDVDEYGENHAPIIR